MATEYSVVCRMGKEPAGFPTVWWRPSPRSEAGPPNLISFKPLEGRSALKLVSEEAGKSEEGEWKIRGGHRLWTAPGRFRAGKLRSAMRWIQLNGRA